MQTFNNNKRYYIKTLQGKHIVLKKGSHNSLGNYLVLKYNEAMLIFFLGGGVFFLKYLKTYM